MHKGVQELDHGRVGQDDEGIKRKTDRFFKYFEERENNKKKAKTEEVKGRISQEAASSSGGGGMEVQRSCEGRSPEPASKRNDGGDRSCWIH